MSHYDSFRAARWIRFINLILQAGLFLSLFAGLNYIALNHSWRFDLTESRRHSLSAETLAYLSDLERNVRIVVTISDDGAATEVESARREITALLGEYTYHTRNSTKGRIEVREVDIYQNRREAEALGVEQPNQVVLITDRHRRALTLGDFYSTRGLQREGFRGEAVLTAAVLDVTRAQKNKIYFLTGHSEMRPDDVSPGGLSQLRDELRQRNYDVETIDLSLTHRIPDDASLLIAASPKGRFQRFEEELLRLYLQNRAGRLFLLLEPGAPHGLENLLFDWGIIVRDNVIIDLDPRSLTENQEPRLWNFIADSSGITDSLRANAMPIISGPARVVTDDMGRSLDDGLRVAKLITTSPEAWGEESYRLNEFKYTPSQDLHGELGVMTISERLKRADRPLSVRGGRLAVLGTATLVTNNRIITVGNLNLFLATVTWAINDEPQVNIPIRPIERFQLALSAEELVRLRLGLLLVLPGIVAAFGLIVYWTRRN